ncbi:hypothetical protein Pint_22873 [Pistacia integerrima]|uniref:Uncharacterized protein n=1 Tax=Pistacia integerrima TaxID=434235 RepID=A0ACC0YK60_9ROSI|nr:hypothetical protein Pint_22873 [Pistacia integerrima]
MWSQSFSHPWHPTEDLSHLLPENPPQYREVFGEYAKEIGALMNRLLSLISQGLGLEKEYLQKRLGMKPGLKAQANYNPPCPEPEFTLGLGAHTDLNAVTILWQSEGVSGLQVLSNGRYKSVHHRAVTNKAQRRMTLAMFYGPNKDTVIGPIEGWLMKHTLHYIETTVTQEFIEEFNRQQGTRRTVKELFELPK